MSAPVDVLAVMDALIASVDDDEIELDARADLSRDGTEARAAVAELIEAAHLAQEAMMLRDWHVSVAAGVNGRDKRTVHDRLRAALARIGGAA